MGRYRWRWSRCDNGDVFPDDVSEWVDTDGDGVGDNGDVFPNDASEWADTDGDGLGNNADILSGCTDELACNYNSSTTLNTDNVVCTYVDGICETCSGAQDGTGTVVDNDSDDDTYCNGTDAFPDDASEWADTDGDGLGNNADILSGCNR